MELESQIVKCLCSFSSSIILMEIGFRAVRPSVVDSRFRENAKDGKGE